MRNPIAKCSQIGFRETRLSGSVAITAFRKPAAISRLPVGRRQHRQANLSHEKINL